MYKLKLLLLPVAWLLAFMALACAPPDDDDRSSAPSKPTINNAIYDVGKALLTVQGTHLSPTTATQAQIQTIVVGSRTNGVAFSSYTADDPATGPDSRGLEKGKYRIANDGTALWLRLTDPHKAALNGKTGMDSDGLKKGLLTSSGAWAGLNTAKDLDVRNIPENKQSKVSDDNQPSKQTEQAEQVEQAEEESRKLPEAEQTEEESPKQPEEAEEDEQVEQAEDQSPEATITRATYHVGTALLTLQGTDLSPTEAQIQTIVVDGLALNSYTADGTATGPDSRSLAKGKYRIKGDGTALWLYLTDDDKDALNGKTGMNTNGLKDGLLSVGTGTWAGLDTAKALAVSGNPPTITRATYHVNTGQLVITGTNLPAAVADWDFSKLTLVSGDGSKSYTLPRHSTAGINLASGFKASATGLDIILSGSVKAEANKILVKNGDSDDNGAYNLEAAAGFAGGSAADTSNPITVSGNPEPTITSATYNVSTGHLGITGTNLPAAVTGWDFSKLTIVSGDGKKRFTLPRRSSTAGENTATGSGVARHSLAIFLTGSVKAEAEKILVNDGVRDNNGAYNLEAAAGFAGGNIADTSNNPITVRGYAGFINNASYNANTGELTIYGGGLPTTIAEWDFSKLTIVSSDGKKRYTLPRHSTLGENRATGTVAAIKGLKIILSGSVKQKAEAIMQDRFSLYNLEAAAGFVPGSTADLKNSLSNS